MRARPHPMSSFERQRRAFVDALREAIGKEALYYPPRWLKTDEERFAQRTRVLVERAPDARGPLFEAVG
jgi:hypothetical protein